jgi:Holliday junction resolvase
MARFIPIDPHDKQAEVKSLVVEVFRAGGWKILEQPRANNKSPDLIAEHAGKKYIIEIKRSSEGRPDRVIPLVAQAILQVRNLAHQVGGHPIGVAIVVANYIPESVAEQVKHFAREHAPEIAVGVMDLHGFRSFAGQGFERFNSEHSKGRNLHLSNRGPISPQLLSDLNQWMLKVLLAPSIPESYLAAPRARYRGASQLAHAAGVSVMSAFRFIEQFSKAGFLEQEHEGLRLVRKKELMDRWLAVNQRSVPEIAVRWILHRGKDALREALYSYASEGGKLPFKSPKSIKDGAPPRSPRVCLGLFAAAEALGLGFVHGVQPYLYLERAEPDALERLGLSRIEVDQNADVYVRIPGNRETVFRGVVLNDGVPACDILQVWLDVAQHPSRGREQADLIWRKVLAPALIDKDER